MSNNDEKKLGKSEYFELREKRLKLVYRILYVIVAIWIAALISIGTQEMTTEIAPMYAFLLAASSLLIINIIKYSLMGFSRQEYWIGLPFPSPRDLPNPEIKHESLALQVVSCITGRFFTTEPLSEDQNIKFKRFQKIYRKGYLLKYQK